MKNSFAVLTIIFFCFIFCINCYAHGGRLDSNGGHWDHSSGTYHYHDGTSGSKNNSSNSSSSSSSNAQNDYYYYYNSSENNESTTKTETPQSSANQKTSNYTIKNAQQKKANSIEDYIIIIIKWYFIVCGVWLVLNIILTTMVKILFKDISQEFSEIMWGIWSFILFAAPCLPFLFIFIVGYGIYLIFIRLIRY